MPAESLPNGSIVSNLFPLCNQALRSGIVRVQRTKLNSSIPRQPVLCAPSREEPFLFEVVMDAQKWSTVAKASRQSRWHT